MRPIELNKIVLIPSSINLLQQERVIQKLTKENKLLIGSALFSLAVLVVMVYSNYKTTTDERKE